MSLLSPKKTKFRKAFKGRIHGFAKAGFEVSFGSYGLKAVQPERLAGHYHHHCVVNYSGALVWICPSIAPKFHLSNSDDDNISSLELDCPELSLHYIEENITSYTVKIPVEYFLSYDHKR